MVYSMEATYPTLMSPDSAATRPAGISLPEFLARTPIMPESPAQAARASRVPTRWGIREADTRSSTDTPVDTISDVEEPLLK